MGKRTKAELKALFTTGRKPSQQDYQDLIDSLVHLDDQAAVDAAVVNTRISDYNTTLNQLTHLNHINTLGDLKLVFNAFNCDIVVQPTQLLRYTNDVSRSTDTTVINPAVGTPVSKFVVQDLLGLSYQDAVIKDIYITRNKYTISGTTFYTDTITSVKIGVNPQIKLQPVEGS